MESGSPADRNTSSRRPLHQLPSEQSQYTEIQPYDLPNSSADALAFRSPLPPPKLPLLTTHNLEAITTNGFIDLSSESGGGEPDDFYRDYRGGETSSIAFTDQANKMAATASEVKQTPSPTRSSSNGTIPKHPAVLGARSQGKPSTYRSASSPLLEDRQKSTAPKPPGFPRSSSQKPSVRELLKRFDQNNEQPAPVPQRPVARPREASDSGPGYLKERPGLHTSRTKNSSPSSTSRTGFSNRETEPSGAKSPPSTRPTQRSKFAAEDQQSNNALSSTPRVVRTRNAPSGKPSSASKTSRTLSPATKSPSRPAPPIPEKRPLFGEIVSQAQGPADIGYGIPAVPRRISDSNLQPIISSTHHHDNTELDLSPSSPTAWYLGVTPALDDVELRKPRKTSHNRAHSDFADMRVNTMNNIGRSSLLLAESPVISKELDAHPIPEPVLSPTEKPARGRSPTKGSSRLPLATKRLSNESSSSSRPNSPLTNKRISNNKFSKPEQRPWSPARPTLTPSRSNTPSHAGRSSTKPSTSSGSLKAYISAPPAKTSPPLRSSRPRQPVSAASTSSSRQKIVDGTGSPQVRSGMKAIRSGLTTEQKPRKVVDVGPVNFAERRARIQRAYTKSIHETEQKEIRAANLRRLNSRGVAGDGKLAANTPEVEATEETLRASEPIPEPKPSPPELPQISTSFDTHPPPEPIENEDLGYDSPTLGMPGAFVVDEQPPMSAVSNVSGTTEIENEVQTEAARLARMPSMRVSESDVVPDEVLQARNHTQESHDGPIQIVLEAVPDEDIRREASAETSNELSLPGTFQEDIGSEEDVYVADDNSCIVDNDASATVLLPQLSPELALSTVPVIDDSHSEFYDASPRQSMNIEPDVQQEVDQQSTEQLPLKSILNDGLTLDEMPRVDLPSLRTALAESPSRSTDDGHYIETPTELEYASSEALDQGNTSEQEDLYGPAYDQNRERHLAASSPNREKRNSTWTEYSIDTNGDSSAQEDDRKYRHMEFAVAESVRKPTPPPKYPTSSLSPLPPLPPKPEAYSNEPSYALPAEKPESPPATQSELAGLTSHNGFGLGIDADTIFSVPHTPFWPESSVAATSESHLQIDVALPPPPTRSPPLPIVIDPRPVSDAYQSSQNDMGRNPESRRPSDDLYSPRQSTSTPRSSAQISQENITLNDHDFIQTNMEPLSEADRAAAEKMKKRLFQRRMLIQELIDTEAVYLKDMNVVEEIYKGTAEACPKLDANDVKIIFRNSDQLVAFSTMMLEDLKVAAAPIYTPRTRVRQSKATGSSSATATTPIVPPSLGTPTSDVFARHNPDVLTDEQKDRRTFVGQSFGKHLKRMQEVYSEFLRSSETASKRLEVLQLDPAVKVWLTECNVVAKDLTAAWDIDALLVKPVQRITRYQLLINQIFEHTVQDHPDYLPLKVALSELQSLLISIDNLKKRIHMVGNIVGRKRKESDIRTGLAKAFGRREKSQTSSARSSDDAVYTQLCEKFNDDYLRLQVVMRDVEYHTRENANYVTRFLQYLSAMELVMRASASNMPEVESKWSRFNMSMRNMGTHALDDYVSKIKKQVIEPFEAVIYQYSPPRVAMKTRAKRRVDYEKYIASKANGKKVDDRLSEAVAQYEALNETLKLELPKLSALTEKMALICLGSLVNIQTDWYRTWQEKVGAVLQNNQIPKDVNDIIEEYNRDFPYVQANLQELSIINGTFREVGKSSGSSFAAEKNSTDEGLYSSWKEKKSRSSESSSRARELSLPASGDQVSPSLPTPDFAKRQSGQFSFSPIVSSGPGFPHAPYPPQAYSNGHSRTGSGSPSTLDASLGRQYSANRPSTSRSYTSESCPPVPRMSTDVGHRRESSSTQHSTSYMVDGPLRDQRPFSGIFHSALPLPDGPEDSQRSSRASSYDRSRGSRYNVIYLAASLFEFNIAATKTEAGYPYLTYAAGEIFDVIGEKGELWLAKNQDDDSETVGWIWCKHFARLAMD